MSYARFSKASDVYVYMDVGGHLACCGCRLGDQWDFHSTQEMVDHLAAHRAAGDTVPEIESDLWEDDTDNFPPGCADGHDWGETFQPYPDRMPTLYRQRCTRCDWLRFNAPAPAGVAGGE